MNLFKSIGVSDFFIVNVNSSLKCLSKLIDPFWEIFTMSDCDYKSEIEIDGKE